MRKFFRGLFSGGKVGTYFLAGVLLLATYPSSWNWVFKVGPQFQGSQMYIWGWIPMKVVFILGGLLIAGIKASGIIFGGLSKIHRTMATLKAEHILTMPFVWICVTYAIAALGFVVKGTTKVSQITIVVLAMLIAAIIAKTIDSIINWRTWNWKRILLVIIAEILFTVLIYFGVLKGILMLYPLTGKPAVEAWAYVAMFLAGYVTLALADFEML